MQYPISFNRAEKFTLASLFRRLSESDSEQLSGGDSTCSKESVKDLSVKGDGSVRLMPVTDFGFVPPRDI